MTSPRTVLASWPRRRWAAFVALLPVLALLLVAAARPVAGPGPTPVAWAMIAAAAVAGAATLASYVPARGLRPDLGCTPCAAVSALTVVAGLVAVQGAGADPTGPALALAATLFGLVQRLKEPAVCPVPGSTAADATGGRERPVAGRANVDL
ncbi:MAG: hypothetical protein ACTHOK_10570 [Nocardioidaceae bacterium]